VNIEFDGFGKYVQRFLMTALKVFKK